MTHFKYDELYQKYLNLLEENTCLKAKIKELEAEPNSFESHPKTFQTQESLFQETWETGSDKQLKEEIIEVDSFSDKSVNHYSVKDDKINLFMSLFKGRSDVFAKRWQNKKGQSGYSPLCLNEWVPGVCNKPRIKCSKCDKKLYSALNEAMIEKHLQGDMVIGIYPMCLDETCSFLAIDFDNKGWEKDISVIRDTCDQIGIPVAVERSRSGNGGHVWFFFKDETSALLARKFGTSLLTYSMEKRHKISFKSYDRLFPNQDTMPKGGFGNLIALPLQKAPRKKGSSLFVDNHFEPYKDQWKFLSDIQKLTEKELISFTTKFSKGNELGVLKNEEISVDKPWIKNETKLRLQDFPKTIEITKSGMLYIKKSGLAQKALNILKRLAAFKNPDFYKSQAMRLSTFNKPRIISCSEDFEDYLALPRGCEEDLISLLKEYNVKMNPVDETTPGRLINIEFNGVLRQEQQEAVDTLMAQDNGVLSATTAFGKTVIGANLISLRKVNTLILVHRQQLLSQWVERLSQFLLINETLPKLPNKRGRKKQLNVIGRLGAGKNNLSSIVDIAIMQSLNTGGAVKDCVKNYGMIIVDECHHVPAFSFEQILKNATARYIYGLTATPYRQDGHHPIIFFYCGPIRFMVDAKKQAEKRPFDHYLIPRFTSFKTGLNKNKEELSIQEINAELVSDDVRNQLIIDDVVECYKKGRNSLILTGRVAHVNSLNEILLKRIPDVISLTGGMGTKKTAEVLKKISSIPVNKPLVLVATGSFIGEGFDEPRLDTLFLAMPISWKGTLQQYAGRLHRLCEGKKDVQIYDYVDIHIRMLENMYGKRLRGYASIGYKAKAGNISDMPTDIIFDKHSFFPAYLNDINNALKQVLIVSPFVTKKRVIQMMHHFNTILKKQVKITIITRPVEDFKENKKTILENIFTILKDAGVQVLFKSNIHQKFAIIDQKITWYGSINLLSFGYSEESIMRLSSSSIAYELANCIKLKNNP
jgi:superfamily II DNA or RNA helicase